jgi:hypothetical protein
MSRTIFAVITAIVAASALSGCAVYAPAPYGYRPGVVVEPAPVVVAPYYYGGWGYYHGGRHW